MLGEAPHYRQAIFGNKVIFGSASGESPITGFFSWMDLAELKIVQVIAKRRRRPNVLLAGLTGDCTETPTVKRLNVSTSDTSSICPLGDFEEVVRIVQSLSTLADVQAK